MKTKENWVREIATECVCVCVGFNSHSLPILCWLLVCIQRVGGVTKLDRPFHLGFSAAII